VFTQISGPDHHFSAYYKDNGILIQFMIVEFLQTYQLTFKIKTLIQEHLDSPQTSETLYSSLIQLLAQLIGCFTQKERPSFSPWIKGSLTKLKEYCEQFSINSSHQNEHHIHLHLAAHQTWLTAVNNLEMLNSSSDLNKKNSDVILFLQSLKKSFHVLQLRFNQVIQYIPKVIVDFWHNENVILCLLRKRSQLVEIYGPDFLYKRFKWPFKAKELVQLLINRYQERGFEALLPTIQHILDSAETLNDAH
jgi:hypothetical protein